MYEVRAIALVGGEEVHKFNNEHDALSKVREYKDLGGYLISVKQLNTETVS